MRNHKRGFTLLEVLAAVSLLIVIFIPLVHVSIDGLRSEGESRRRLEASLIADRELASIESDLVLGTVPKVGETTTEEHEFRIVTSIKPFELPFAVEEKKDPPPRGSVPTSSIFPEPNSREESPLRKIEITVFWPSPGGGGAEFGDEFEVLESRVVRTTFALDIEGIADKLAVINFDRQIGDLLEDQLGDRLPDPLSDPQLPGLGNL